MMKRIAVVALILLCLLLALALPAYAQTADPDSMSMTDIAVNRNLLETGDVLVYGLYEIAYAAPPSEDADQTFLFQLIDTDGTTILADNEAYPFENQGYGKGVISFYFAAADAPAWGAAYWIKITGKPGMFVTPPSQLFIINAGDYSSETTQSGNQGELADNIIALARQLEVEWTPVTLLTEIETGTVLDADGEEYFRNSIWGVQGMAPSIFDAAVQDPSYTERTWNTTQQTIYEQRFTNTTVGNSVQGIADLFSVDFNLIASIPILLGAVLCIIGAVKWNGKPESGFLCSMLLLIGGFFAGWTPGAIVGIASILAGLYIAMAIIGKIPT